MELEQADEFGEGEEHCAAMVCTAARLVQM
jgi:hypothetical protein